MSPAESTRVGYVLKQYPRYSETFIVNELLAHEAAGLEVEIFSLRPATDQHFQDVIARVRAPVHYVPCHGLRADDFWSAWERVADMNPSLGMALEAARGEEARDVYQALVIAREAHSRGITHLHAHFASVATAVARLASRFASIPYTFTAHAKDIFHESVRHDDLRRKAEDAAAVVTVSEFNHEYLRRTLGGRLTPIRRIYNGLDLGDFPYDAPNDRPPRIAAVGRLVEKKGFADLIDACAILLGRGLRFDCRIVGAGDQEEDLRARIEARGLMGRVELLGPRPQGEVVRTVQGSAVLAAPCIVARDGNRDGLPTVLLEAMALGTPCVSTDVTGIPEVLRHDDTGLMVPQHDPEALAEALSRFLTDPALRVRVASRARRLIQDEFDSRRNSHRLRALFTSGTALDGRVTAAGGVS